MLQRRVRDQPTNPGSLQPSPREMSTLDLGSSCLEILGEEDEINGRILANSEPVSLPRKPALLRSKQTCFLLCPPPHSRGPRLQRLKSGRCPGAGGALSHRAAPRCLPAAGVQAETPGGKAGCLGRNSESALGPVASFHPLPSRKDAPEEDFKVFPSQGESHLESFSQKERQIIRLEREANLRAKRGRIKGSVRVN